jgi:hypothetical protein
MTDTTEHTYEGKSVTDPHMIMLAALVRDQARGQLQALHRISQAARRFLAHWDQMSSELNMQDPDLLVKWLHHEQPDRVYTHMLEEEMRRMKHDVEDYQKCDHAQEELNRVRLALMADPDFPSAPYWMDVIQSCAQTAAQSAQRRK